MESKLQKKKMSSIEVGTQVHGKERTDDKGHSVSVKTFVLDEEKY